jgi:hypothetical protein
MTGVMETVLRLIVVSSPVIVVALAAIQHFWR